MGAADLGSKNTREWTDIHDLPGMKKKIKPGYIAVNRDGELKYLKTDKPKNPVLNKDDGYLRYHWEHKGRHYSVMVHRLVGMAYCDGYKPGLVIDHLDTNKTNNNYKNLMFGTQKQNSNNPETLKKLRAAKVRGSRRVTAYFFDGTPFKMFDSIKEASKELDLPKLPLQEGAIRREGIKHCYGLLWKSTPCTTDPKTLSRKECLYGKTMPPFMTITTSDGKRYVANGYTVVADHMGVTPHAVRKALETGEPCKGAHIASISCREYWQLRKPEMFA